MLTGRKAQIAELRATKVQAAMQPSIGHDADTSHGPHIVHTWEVAFRSRSTAPAGLDQGSG